MCEFNCSSEVEMLVEDAVETLVAEKKKFTAFDVTKAVREETDETVFHKDIRQLIHTLMDGYQDKYDRDNHPVHAAFIYAPKVDVNPVKVPVPTARTFSSNPGTIFNLTSQAKTGSRITMSEKKNLKPDARGSISVRAEDLRKIGLTPGQKARASLFTGKVVVTPASAPKLSSHASTEYTVDAHNNVRITKNALAKAGLNKGEFKVKTHPHSLEIV